MLDLAERLKRRGLVVVVSDLLDDPEAVEKALKLLCLKGNDVIVFHILDSVELEFPFEGLARMDDVETDRNITVECEVVKRPYLGLLTEFLEQTRERCADLGVGLPSRLDGRAAGQGPHPLSGVAQPLEGVAGRLGEKVT